MWHILPTEKWIEQVVHSINKNQLKPEESKFMIAFFSSMDNDFVEYFQKNKKQISSFSGCNFHIFTPLIYEDNIIPDEHWRYMRNEFISLGIPLGIEPTFVFFNLEKCGENYDPIFFAGFECKTFDEFPGKLKNAIDYCIGEKDARRLPNKLSEIFLSKNIIPIDKVNEILKETIKGKLPTTTIFISHSSKDKLFVRKLEAEICKDPLFKFWIDEEEISCGDNIYRSISKALSGSDYLFLIVSEDSSVSSWVTFEVSQFMAFTESKKIIPIIISKKRSSFSKPIENLIAGLKYVDFTDDNKWESSVNELKKAIGLR